MIRYDPVKLRNVLRSRRTSQEGWWHPIAGRAAVSAEVCANGAHGLVMALHSISGNGPVIVTASTCDRVVIAAVIAGDTPRFVDVGEQSGALRPDESEETVWQDAKAVILTPQCGVSPNWKALLARAGKRGVVVVEDRAIAVSVPDDGASSPDYAVYSFGRGKPAPLVASGMAIRLGSHFFDLVEMVG